MKRASHFAEQPGHTCLTGASSFGQVGADLSPKTDIWQEVLIGPGSGLTDIVVVLLTALSRKKA
jgi:hypothetical protein